MERIGNILGKQGLGAVQRAFALAQLTEEWPRLLGEPWGSMSWPLRMQNGILWIGVPDSSWAQRFAFENRRLRLRIEARLGNPVELRAQISRPAEPPPPDKPPVVGVNTPEVEAAVSAMPDGALRDIMRGYLGRLAAYQKTDAEREKP